MNHVGCILRQPDYLAFNSQSDRSIESLNCALAFGAYFDSIGHETRRGFHALNFPAKSWRRASRSSAIIFGFCDINQSKSPSRLSTDESTGTGISTVSFGISPAYRFELEKRTRLASPPGDLIAINHQLSATDSQPAARPTQSLLQAESRAPQRFHPR